MKTEEIVEGNKLIAEFMGYTPYSDGWITIPHETFDTVVDSEIVYQLRFHTSWDWLMPVVEKIESLQPEGFNTLIEGGCCWIEYPEISFEGIEHTKIEATWSAVCEFITWYNENKETKQ
jgi:hypothetical protein